MYDVSCALSCYINNKYVDNMLSLHSGLISSDSFLVLYSFKTVFVCFPVRPVGQNMFYFHAFDLTDIF